MSRNVWIRLASLAVGALLLALSVAPGSAAVPVPAGTTVGLKLLNTLDSQHLPQGSQIHFKVAADVLVDRHTIIRAGAPATGTATKVSKPGVFGSSSQVIIGLLTVTAVDKKPLKLQDVKINADSLKKNVAGAVGASVAGAIILGPVGLASGALVRGGWVQVPAGSIINAATQSHASVSVP